jgi:hypothetical protein
MRKNNKTWLLRGLVVWALAECGYCTYVNVTYGARGRLAWPSYAYDRNHAAITRLYDLTAPGRTQRVYLEARGGQLADSVGHLPAAARALVQQLAHDIAPAGYFSFSLDLVRNQPDYPLVVEGPCPPLPGCPCRDELPLTPGGGVLLQLSASSDERHHTPTELEYVRISHAGLQAALQQRPCYAQIHPGEFLGAQGLPASLPLRYSEYQRDLVVSKALRAVGLL